MSKKSKHEENVQNKPFKHEENIVTNKQKDYILEKEDDYNKEHADKYLFVFVLDNEEITTYKIWLEQHKKVCPMYLYLDSCGENDLTWDDEEFNKIVEGRSPEWIFAQTGIGISKYFVCQCGRQKDVTNYDVW